MKSEAGVPDRRADIRDILRQRVVSGLHLGMLAPGRRLPSTRELAEEFEATPRTIMAAYAALAAEGLVELRTRSGIYVAGRPAGGPMLSQLAGWVAGVLLEARAREIPPIEFPERVRRCLETLRLRAACIAGNADQLRRICTELSLDYGLETDAIDTSELGAGDEAARALARADLLVTTALDAAAVQSAATRLHKPVVVVTLRTELMTEMTRLLREGPVYFVGTDPRFANALRAIFGPTGSASNLRPVILGRDDPDAIPENAPAYVMPSARERLGDTPLTRRVVPIPRVFSTDTARELLTFIIRANIAALAARAA
jgi:hypothetical protein